MIFNDFVHNTLSMTHYYAWFSPPLPLIFCYFSRFSIFLLSLRYHYFHYHHAFSSLIIIIRRDYIINNIFIIIIIFLSLFDARLRWLSIRHDTPFSFSPCRRFRHYAGFDGRHTPPLRHYAIVFCRATSWLVAILIITLTLDADTRRLFIYYIISLPLMPAAIFCRCWLLRHAIASAAASCCHFRCCRCRHAIIFSLSLSILMLRYAIITPKAIDIIFASFRHWCRRRRRYYCRVATLLILPPRYAMVIMPMPLFYCFHWLAGRSCRSCH